MKHEDYFNITENAKNYDAHQWNDETVLCYGVPNDMGFAIMTMYEAMAFLANNDPCSMIALRLPKEQFELLQGLEEDDRIDIKEEWFVDYKGECL